MKRVDFENQEKMDALTRRYEDIYKKNPGSKIFAPLADSYRKRGRLDEALRISLDGVRSNPDYSSGKLVLGKCLFDRRMYYKAISHLESVTEVNPLNNMARIYLGKAYLGNSDWEKALKVFLQAGKISPKDDKIKGIIKRLVGKMSEKGENLSRESTQMSLASLAKRPLFNIETDQFVLRPMEQIFSQAAAESKDGRSLSPVKRPEATGQSLQKLFLKQGLNQKATRIGAEPIPEFKPDKLSTRIVSADNELIMSSVIKKDQIIPERPDVKAILENSNLKIPLTVEALNRADRDEFPGGENVEPDYRMTTVEPGLQMDREEITEDSEGETAGQVPPAGLLKNFDGADPEGYSGVRRRSPMEAKEKERNRETLRNVAVHKLNMFLSRIQERAY